MADAQQTGFPHCTTCQTIISCFSPSNKPLNRSIGKISSLLMSSCPHSKFFKNLKFRDGRRASDYEEKELRILDVQKESFMVFWVPDLNAISEGVGLFYRSDVDQHPGKTIVVDPQWIDKEIIKTWISTCDGTHGSRCKDPLLSREGNIQPFYLIDTQDNCIVESNKSMKEYVALSYVWGQTKNLQNNSELCQKLREKDVLASGELSQLLPATIKDAMAIVRFLGKRYLWVDSLCIVQDDKQLLESELSRMHHIYACSSFTIIAAVGTDADHGLRGFKGLTRPRSLRQDPIQLAGSEKIMLDNITRPTQETRTSYYKRGWTFQERLFSKRRLLFQSEGIKWECQCSTWCEDLMPTSEIKRSSDDHDQFFYKTVPTLVSLWNTMTAYNEKIFTFPEDAIPAFQGFQSILHRTFPGGLIYGHPEFFFAITLSWSPLQSIKRRVPQAATKHLPSWSWLGWQGQIHFPIDQEITELLGNVTELEGYKTPVAEWYTASSPTATEKRQINSAWQDYRLLAQEEDSAIASGWSRENYEIEAHITNPSVKGISEIRGVPKYRFRHPDLKKREPLLWYPIPVLEHTCPESPIQLQTPLIFAQTSRAYLYVNTTDFEPERVPSDLKTWGPPSLRLSDRSGNFVGHLQVHHGDDLVEFQKGIASGNRKRVELVATCKGYTGKIFDYELGQRIKEEKGAKDWAPQLKNCYFILWIEWKDGVAYRRGAGAVTEDAWESERESELVDLVLG